MRIAVRITGLGVACLGLVLAPGMAQARQAPAGLPPGVKDVPLPGVAGTQARRARANIVHVVSSSHFTVAARRQTPIELEFQVTDGFHINSHTPRDKTLIPTRLVTAAPRGLQILSVDFPPGEGYTPAFAPKEKLSVYSGKFALRVDVRAAPGKHILKAALHYQACDVNSCLPPRTLPLEIQISTR